MTFKIFGVNMNSKFIHEHVCSLSYSVAQKIDTLRKSYNVLADHSTLQ